VSVTIAELSVLIGADITGVTTGVKEANNRLNEFGGTVQDTGRTVNASMDSAGRSVDDFSAKARRDFDDLRQKMVSTETSLQGFGRSLQTAGRSMSIGLTAPLLALGRAAIQSEAHIDGMRRGLVAVTGSAAAADAEFAHLQETAKLPGIGMQEALSGALNLQAAGLSAKEADRYLRAFGGAIAAVGGGKAQLGIVTDELARMTATGKITEQELRAIGGSVPQIRQAAKAAFGTADFAELEKSGLDAKQILGGVVEQLERMGVVGTSLQNDLDNASDSITQSLASIGEAMTPLVKQFLDGFLPALQDTVKAFRSLPQPMQQGTLATAAFAAALGPVAFGLGGMTKGFAGLLSGSNKLVGFFAETATGATGLAAALERVAVSAAGVRTALMSTTMTGGGLLAVAGAGIVGGAIGTGIDYAIQHGEGIAQAQEDAAASAEAYRKRREAIESTRPALAALIAAQDRLRGIDEKVAEGQLRISNPAYLAGLRTEIGLLREKAEVEAKTAKAPGGLAAAAMSAAAIRTASNAAVSQIEDLRKQAFLAANGNTAVNNARWEIWYGSLQKATAALKEHILAEAAAKDAAEAGASADKRAASAALSAAEAVKRHAEALKNELTARLYEATKAIALNGVETASVSLRYDIAAGKYSGAAKALAEHVAATLAQGEAAATAREKQEAFRKSIWATYTATRIARAEAVAAAQGRTLAPAEKFAIERDDPTTEAGGMALGQYQLKYNAMVDTDQAAAQGVANRKTYDEASALTDRYNKELQRLTDTLDSASMGETRLGEAARLAAKLATDEWAKATEQQRQALTDKARMADNAAGSAEQGRRQSAAQDTFEQLKAEMQARLSEIAGQSERSKYELQIRKQLKDTTPDLYESSVSDLMGDFDQAQKKDGMKVFSAMLTELTDKAAALKNQLHGVTDDSQQTKLQIKIDNDPKLQALKESDPTAYTKKVSEVMEALKGEQGLESLVTVAHTVGERMADALVGSLDALRTKGFGGFFRSVEQGFATMIRDISAQILKAQLERAITGALGSAIGGGVGKSIIAGAREGGGDVDAGRAYIVGERRAEVFVPKSSGMIYPSTGAYHVANAAAGAGGRGGQAPIIQHFTINTPDAGSFRQSQSQILADAHRQAEYERKRSGH